MENSDFDKVRANGNGHDQVDWEALMQMMIDDGVVYRLVGPREGQWVPGLVSKRDDGNWTQKTDEELMMWHMRDLTEEEMRELPADILNYIPMD